MRSLRKLSVLLLLFLAALVWVVEAAATHLNLSWSDNADNEDGVKVERRSGASGIFVEIATVGTDAGFFTDSGLTEGATYCYRVRAFNEAGYSEYSNEANRRARSGRVSKRLG